MKIRGNRIYDESGRFQGRLRDNGRIVDKPGRLQARTRDSGRVVDTGGRHLGKVRDDKIYDRSNRRMKPAVIFGDD